MTLSTPHWRTGRQCTAPTSTEFSLAANTLSGRCGSMVLAPSSTSRRAPGWSEFRGLQRTHHQRLQCATTQRRWPFIAPSKAFKFGVTPFTRRRSLRLSGNRCWARTRTAKNEWPRWCVIPHFVASGCRKRWLPWRYCSPRTKQRTSLAVSSISMEGSWRGPPQRLLWWKKAAASVTGQAAWTVDVCQWTASPMNERSAVRGTSTSDSVPYSVRPATGLKPPLVPSARPWPRGALQCMGTHGP